MAIEKHIMSSQSTETSSTGVIIILDSLNPFFYCFKVSTKVKRAVRVPSAKKRKSENESVSGKSNIYSVSKSDTEFKGE